MEPITLHPFEPTLAAEFVDALVGGTGHLEITEGLRTDLELTRSGNEAASNRLTFAFAQHAAARHPAFFTDGFGFTTWEARVDRGIGMLMRPPSRLFVDAGLERSMVATMPIRLDLQGGLMAGAWIPARLIDDLRTLLDTRLERMARRLHEAEYDPYVLLGLMQEAVAYAHERQLGLLEAIGVVGPNGEHPAGVRLVVPDRKRLDADLAQRITAAITPPKKPSLLKRLIGKGKTSSNGSTPH